MTVRELKEKIAKLDDDMQVVAYREIDRDTEFYDVIDVSAARGTPRRLEDGKFGLTFDHAGAVQWLLITIGEG